MASISWLDKIPLLLSPLLSISLSILFSLKNCHLISLLNRGGSCPVAFVCLLSLCSVHVNLGSQKATAKKGLFLKHWLFQIDSVFLVTSKPKSFLFKDGWMAAWVTSTMMRVGTFRYNKMFCCVRRWRQRHDKVHTKSTACHCLGVMYNCEMLQIGVVFAVLFRRRSSKVGLI